MKPSPNPTPAFISDLQQWPQGEYQRWNENIGFKSIFYFLTKESLNHIGGGIIKKDENLKDHHQMACFVIMSLKSTQSRYFVWI